jgi:hypothetical protein
MSDVRHVCVYCCCDSCNGSAVKRFPTLRENGYRTVCVCYTVAMVILLRSFWSHDLHC